MSAPQTLALSAAVAMRPRSPASSLFSISSSVVSEVPEAEEEEDELELELDEQELELDEDDPPLAEAEAGVQHSRHAQWQRGLGQPQWGRP